MREIFADTGYWVAIIDPDDVLHESVKRIVPALPIFQTVTSSAVLTEVLAHFSRSAIFRPFAAIAVESILSGIGCKLIEVDRLLYVNGLEMYGSYADKQWSHVDCISFHIMRSRGITQALSHDTHFRQAGFETLI